MEWKQHWVFGFHAFRAHKSTLHRYGPFSLFPFLLRWLGMHIFTASSADLTSTEIGFVGNAGTEPSFRDMRREAVQTCILSRMDGWMMNGWKHGHSVLRN
jgi:hypothetical protein